VLKGSAKVSRDEIEKIVKVTTLFGWSNRFLKNYYEKLLRAPENN
jgi:hypothetical protein